MWTQWGVKPLEFIHLFHVLEKYLVSLTHSLQPHSLHYSKYYYISERFMMTKQKHFLTVRFILDSNYFIIVL